MLCLQRLDGRQTYDYRNIKITFGTDYGCCIVELGKTRYNKGFKLFKSAIRRSLKEPYCLLFTKQLRSVDRLLCFVAKINIFSLMQEFLGFIVTFKFLIIY